MENEQYKYSTELEARIKAGILAEAGQHGAIILSREPRRDAPDFGTTYYYVETDPVGMIRTWEKEVFTF